MSKVGSLVWKDALSEARTRERLPTLVVFGAAMLLTMRLALPAEAPARAQVAAAFVWAAVIFSATIELRSSYGSEKRDGTLDALRLAPIDPVVILVAKLVSSYVVLVVLEVVLVGLAILFFGGPASAIATGTGVVALATIGLLAWGQLFALATEQSRSSEILLPVILFPLLVPQTIAVVRLLATALGGPAADSSTGFILLAAVDVLALGTSILLFEYVLGE